MDPALGLLPINDFRDTERHPGTLSDREKGRRKGRTLMRRCVWLAARTYAPAMRGASGLDRKARGEISHLRDEAGRVLNGDGVDNIQVTSPDR